MIYLCVVTVLLGLIVCDITAQMNLAGNGTTSQSSVYRWVDIYLTSDLAVTGGPTNDFYSKSCATTDDTKYKAWWMLTFPVNTAYITNINIYYRSGFSSRLAGYYLYVTNTSVSNASPKPPDADLCYHDAGPDLPSIIQNVTCNALGRNIVVYNERNKDYIKPGYSATACLEMCDVQVFGCYKTWYGRDCNLPCPVKCFDKHCYPENGTCVWGCNCLQDRCDNASTCSEGCEKGFGGQHCLQNNIASNGKATQHPSPGTQHAAKATDGDRRQNSCAVTSGSEAWWQLDLGNRSAVTAIYVTFKSNVDVKANVEGHSLYVTSSSDQWMADIPLNMTSISDKDNRTGKYHINTVVLGRYITYVPPKIDGTAYVDICEVEVIGCSLRQYGPDCKKTCPENCHDSCHPVTGRCMFGCNDGWIGMRCDQHCTSPRFGQKCISICHCKNNNTCDYVNGTCPDGLCAAGWRGTGCSEECNAGYYGENCIDECGACLSDTCNRFNGHCNITEECKPGWSGVKCDKECDDGYFGNCSMRCHCAISNCNKETGECTNSACEKGWMGSTCSEECSEGHYGFNCRQSCKSCFNNTCDRIDGNCTYGCVDGFSGYRCHFIERKLQSSGSLDATPVGVGVTLAVLVMVLAISGGLFYRRRLNGKRDNRPQRRSVARSNIYANVVNQVTSDNNSEEDTEQIICGFGADSKQADEDQINTVISKTSKKKRLNTLDDKGEYRESEAITDNVYNNTALEPDTCKIPIEELSTSISEKRKDENAGFENEYFLLPKGLVHRHAAATLEHNKIKNRFLKTLPYDHSRVILQGDKNSDFINASYIDNYSKKRAYIASQGPKRNTVEDFWRMIVQEGVDVVVMLTRLEEERRTKCERYWPETSAKPEKYGHVTVFLMEEKSYTMCIYRQLRIKNTLNKEERKVHQYHFVQWPDHGVPDTVKLATFYKKVKRAKHNDNVPLLVHCSAGVGRTGTFIAIDALYEHGLATGCVDVLDYAQMMRKDRVNMIQTVNQYAAVYDALLELFTVPSTTVDVQQFCSFMDDEDSKKVPKNQSVLWREFQKLQNMIPTYSEDCFKAAKLRANIHKNVTQKFLTHDKYRPFLMSTESTSNDYINAVIIPTYQANQRIFVTQYPLSETVVDFWTMVYDFDCTTVVLLEDINQEVQIWPKEENECHFGKFVLKRTRNGAEQLASLTLRHRDIQENRLVAVFATSEWTTDNVPVSNSSVLNLIQNVLSWQDVHPGNITVVCRDGSSRSGLFAALSLILEKLELDEEVDIFQTVRFLQIRRPQFFQSYGQYEFCYNCIKEHLNGKNEGLVEESLYANA